ncbi:translation initiation factor 2 [Roseovarius aestuarii]|nr:translation initiation factor 2 [Roseovarius aestuarii]
MSRFLTIAAFAASALTLSACATAVRGTSEAVSFTSQPSGVQVTTSFGISCTTPCSMDIKRRQAFTAVFTHGKAKRMVNVASKTGAEGIAAGAGNVLAGGIIGVAVDASTGATLEHMPNPVHADFSKPQSAAQANAEAHAKAVIAARAKKHQEAKKATNPGQNPVD